MDLTGKLHDAAATTGNGTVLQLGGKIANVVIQIEGAGGNSARTIGFKGKNKGAAAYDDIMGIKAADFSVNAIQATDLARWIIPVDGVNDFYCPLSAITTGTVTVYFWLDPKTEY